MPQEDSHYYGIKTDREAEVIIRQGWWFKVFHSWLESGWWAVLSPAAKAVAVVMAKFANEAEGGKSWPGVDTIARYAGLWNNGHYDQTSVYRALRELQAASLLIKTVRGYKGKRHPAWLVQEATRSPPQLPRGIKGPPVSQDFTTDGTLPRMSNCHPATKLSINNRVRSDSELESEDRSNSIVSPREVEQWMAHLTEDEAALLKGKLLKTLNPVQRDVFAKSHIKSSHVLATIAYQFLMATK